MEIVLYNLNGVQVARIESNRMVIVEVQDALDLMADCAYQGAQRLIMKEHHFHPDFFDLKTRLAGEILQKFSNYRIRLAIVGHFNNHASKSMQDFIRESNRLGQVSFVQSDDEAYEKLTQYH